MKTETAKDSEEHFSDYWQRIFKDLDYAHPCKTCGKPEQCMDEDSQCLDCWEASPERAAERAEEERIHAEAVRRIALRELESIVSPDIRETDIDHPDFNGEAWKRVSGAYNPEASDWFWLHSHTSGRCKSRCAYLLLLEQYSHAIKPKVSKSGGSWQGRLPTVLWVDGDRLTEACRIRHQYSLGERVMADAHALVDEARTAPFLVIDDLTKRKITGEAASDGLWEVLKHRHEWKLRTIITDNVIPEAMEDMLHEKHAPYIIRRLAERCIQVDFDATPCGSSPSGQSCGSQSGEC